LSFTPPRGSFAAIDVAPTQLGRELEEYYAGDRECRSGVVEREPHHSLFFHDDRAPARDSPRDRRDGRSREKKKQTKTSRPRLESRGG